MLKALPFPSEEGTAVTYCSVVDLIFYRVSLFLSMKLLAFI